MDVEYLQLNLLIGQMQIVSILTCNEALSVRNVINVVFHIPHKYLHSFPINLIRRTIIWIFLGLG
jgi:hypothetical protein